MSDLKTDLRELAYRGEKAELEDKFLEAVSSCPQDLDLFLDVGGIVLKAGRKGEAGTLLSMLVEHYQENGTPEDRIRLFRFLCESQEKERSHRLALVEAYQAANQNNKAFEVFLEASGLKGRGPLSEAMEALARMEEYEVGKYVRHASSWGMGRIDDVDAYAGELLITFENGKKHQLPVQSALDILEPAADDDWRVLRAFKPDEFKALCDDDPGSVIAAILKQVGRSQDTTSFKHHLVGKGIEAGSWSKWWTKARKQALKRPDVVQDGKSNKLIYTDPAEFDPFEDMREVASAGQVLDLANSYLRSHPDVTADEIQTLAALLVEGSARHAPDGHPAPLELLLMADDLAETHELPRDEFAAVLRDRLAQEGSLPRLAACKSLRLAKRALPFMKEARGDRFKPSLLRLVPLCAGQFLESVIEMALAEELEPQLQEQLNAAFHHPDSDPELLVWANRRRHHKRFEPLLSGLDPKRLLKRCLFLGEAQGRQVNAEHRKLARGVATELLAGNGKNFKKFLETLTAEETRTWRKLVLGLRGMTDSAHDSLMAMFPFDAQDQPDDEDTEFYDDTIIYSTAEGIQKRQEEYDHLVNIKLPEVFEAIGKAASFGDLSENAEYSAALEERATQTRKAEIMKEELKQAKVIDPSLLIDGTATVGTKVKVRNAEDGEEEEFTLLGPWESDFEKGILDYRAPLSKALLGHKVGETVAATVGRNTRHYEILNVESVL